MNRKELKAEHQRLNEDQPFTDREKKVFDKKDMSMIRNIQILNGINKRDAVSVLKAYKSTPKQTLARMARAYRARLKKYSSPQKAEGRGIIPPRGHRKAPSVRQTSTYANNRDIIAKWLKNPDNKNNIKIYNRVEKAHHKYIDASLQECKHGVINSKWSEDYREKTGLSRKYEGRIIK